MGRKKQKSDNNLAIKGHTPGKKSVCLPRVIHQAHAGPIPDPQTFIEYREIREDLPDIIISEWTANSRTRRKAIAAVQFLETLRVIGVLLFIAGILVLSYLCVIAGEYKYATGVIMSPLALKAIEMFMSKK